MYELKSGCRAALSARPVVPVPVGEGLSRERWAKNEMRRWETSVWQSVWLTVRTAEAPRSPAAAGGNMAAVTGFYRLPSARRIWGGHAEKHPGAAQGAHARGRTRNTVLCHGTDLNFATRAQCDGRGTTRPAPRPPGFICTRRWTTPVYRRVC